jgi:general secretion pathway protein E
LSTLHTNSAAGAIVRLQDMGIENYLIGATLRGVVSQRLVRTICAKCQGADGRPGCSRCRGSGYSGRLVTYEILEVSDDVRRSIDTSGSESNIEQQAINDGMVQLRRHASGLVARGVTTEAEVARVVELMRS